jgi:hypothetical protein
MLSAVVLLAGCWAAPVATVQPTGPPRVIQRKVWVQSVLQPSIVQSIDPFGRTIVLKTPTEIAARAYKVSAKVPTFDLVTARDKVSATVVEELTVYVSRDGRLPGLDRPLGGSGPDAKVLSVDPSYRLLTLQYPDGRIEILKTGTEVELGKMGPGDDVLIHPIELISLSLGKQP